MRNLLPFAAAAAIAIGAIADRLLAHGGQYRGPGNVAPNSNANGGTGGAAAGDTGSGGTGSTSTPANGGATGSGGAPTSAGPSTLGGGGAPVRGAPLDDDLTRWEFWWEFGKDPYLRLRDAVEDLGHLVAPEDALLNPRFRHRLGVAQPPNDADLQRVVDGLAAVLRQAKDRDTVSACLVALAKIGRDGAGWRLHDLLVPLLARNDQELRETAALALGIAQRGDRPSLELLSALVSDSETGRRASGGAVNERTRAFAAYGLGLQLHHLRRPASAFRVVELLRGVVADRTLGWNLRVAAIEALGLFPGDWHGAGPDTLRGAIVETLGAYYLADAGPGEQLVQAHVPTVLARLLEADEATAARWRDTFATELRRGLATAGPADPRAKTNAHVAQSCALALGDLTSPWDAPADPGAAIGELLVRVHRDHRDQQTRAFATLALARMGGTAARDALLRELEDAQPALELPWCALALGVWQARERHRATSSGRPPEPDRRLRATLRAAFREARTPAAVGALALALGLARDRDAGVELRSALVEHAHRDELAGYLALGLGLMGDLDATGEVRALVATSARRPQVLQQCVRSLGLLGDHEVVPQLCKELEHPEPSLVRLSAVAAALGQIGDRRALPPLLAMLEDQRLTPLTRAFAAVALGMVCDKDPLPWNAGYATHTNYRAATETLTDGAAGILDIL